MPWPDARDEAPSVAHAAVYIFCRESWATFVPAKTACSRHPGRARLFPNAVPIDGTGSWDHSLTLPFGDALPLAGHGRPRPAETRGARWLLSLPFSFSPRPGFPAAAYGPVAAAAVAAARGSGRGARGRANPQSAGSGKSSVGILCGCSSPSFL